MKLNDDQRMLATVIPLMVMLAALFVVAMWPERQEQSSSFVATHNHAGKMAIR